MAIRITAKEISMQGRITSGVRILNTGENDFVTDFAVIEDH